MKSSAQKPQHSPPPAPPKISGQAGISMPGSFMLPHVSATDFKIQQEVDAMGALLRAAAEAIIRDGGITRGKWMPLRLACGDAQPVGVHMIDEDFIVGLMHSDSLASYLSPSHQIIFEDSCVKIVNLSDPKSVVELAAKHRILADVLRHTPQTVLERLCGYEDAALRLRQDGLAIGSP